MQLSIDRVNQTLYCQNTQILRFCDVMFFFFVIKQQHSLKFIDKTYMQSIGDKLEKSKYDDTFNYLFTKMASLFT